MKNKILSSLALTMATVIAAPMVVNAATELKDSTGSSKGEDGVVVGEDINQGKQTEYYDEGIKADAESNSCEVYATQASTFSVIIPKTIILDGAKNEDGINIGEYVVTVNGNIGGIETIHVNPDDSFKMKQAGKEDLDATVKQTYVNFVVEERTEDSLVDGMTAENTAYGVDKENGATSEGVVSVENLSAGSWSGQFNFNIQITTDVEDTEPTDEPVEEPTDEPVEG